MIKRFTLLVDLILEEVRRSMNQKTQSHNKLLFIIIVWLSIIICSCSSFQPRPDEITYDILVNGKWYNDNYNIIFKRDKTFKAIYKYGNKKGIVSGTYFIDKNKRYSHPVIKLRIEYRNGIGFILNGTLWYNFSPRSLKSTRNINLYYFCPVWNENSFHKPGTIIKRWHSSSAQTNCSGLYFYCYQDCITLGYKDGYIKENARIREQPYVGENNIIEYRYKDTKTNKIKTHTSIFAKTKVKILARTMNIMKIDKWENYWYYIEYKEPYTYIDDWGVHYARDGVFNYRNAWVYGEFIHIR